MKSLITALVAICLLATPVLAYSSVRTELMATGETTMKEYADVWGFDWSEPKAWVPTGFILENIENKGEIYVNKEVINYGQWELTEDKEIIASGVTEIKKSVLWWTEDSTLWENADPRWRYPYGQPGELGYPTITNIYTLFQTQTTNVEKDVHNVANLPPHETINYFSEYIYTTDPMYYMESVGINKDLRCYHDKPIYPDMPECGCFNCDC